MPREIEINLPPGAEKLWALLKTFPFILILAFVLALITSFYQVPADSEAVVFRFGKIIGSTPDSPSSGTTVHPGLHFKMPFGIDRVEIVPVDRQMKQEFGFATPDYTSPYQISNDPEEVRSMVTGDSNLAEVTWIIQYRISDPVLFLTRVSEPEKTLRDVSESVMRSVIGDRTVDEVLTTGRQDIEAQALVEMQDLATRYELGVKLNQVQLRDVNPPKPVQASFNSVNQAKQERERLVNDAQAEYNRVVPKAGGQAKGIIAEAEGYAKERVNRALGDTVRFNLLYTEYQKAPEVTRRRMYLETMSLIFPMFGRKIIMEDSAAPPLSLLPLSDWPTKTTAEPAKTTTRP